MLTFVATTVMHVLRLERSLILFADWYTRHEPTCAKNYEGSAGQMEPRDMLCIFRRSEEKHNLRYTGYFGDGDSKSFSTVANAEPSVYIGVEIRKLVL